MLLDTKIESLFHIRTGMQTHTTQIHINNTQTPKIEINFLKYAFSFFGICSGGL